MKSKPISLGLAAMLLAATIVFYLRFPSVGAQAPSQTTEGPHIIRAGPNPMLPPTPHVAYSALWRVDYSFESMIHIKNLLAVSSIEVTPVLYMADGTRYPLPAVKLVPGGVADVSVNQALAAAPESLAGHLSLTGSAALNYTYSTPGVAAGEMMITDVPRSLIFVQGFMEPMPLMHEPSGPQVTEGIWWKRDDGVSGFVSLANGTAQPESVKVQVVGARGTSSDADTIELAPRESRMLDLDAMIAPLPRGETREGGLRVQYDGQPGDVLVAGGLENDREGYSATMPFSALSSASQTSGPFTIVSPGLMVGAQDPSMGFPDGTRFTPYLTLRNTTGQPIRLTPALYLADNSSTQSYSLPSRVLGPYETRQADVASWLRRLGLQHFSGSVNLTISSSGDGRFIMHLPQ